jgi:shikimate kinase
MIIPPTTNCVALTIAADVPINVGGTSSAAIVNGNIDAPAINPNKKNNVVPHPLINVINYMLELTF